MIHSKHFRSDWWHVGLHFAPLVALFALFGLALLIATCQPLGAQEPHMHGDTPADASWYPGLKQPGSAASCCGSRDCALSSYCSTDMVPEGVVAPDGTCIPMPYERLVPPPQGVTLMPGEVHLCAQHRRGAWRVLCLVGGAGV